VCFFFANFVPRRARLPAIGLKFAIAALSPLFSEEFAMAAHYTIEQAQELQLPVLISTSPKDGAFSVAIDRPVCVVGARRLVHLPLCDSSISKAQALIVIESAGVYLRDLASRNQTFVNDQPVREVRLEKNDIVRFGSHVFTCEGAFDRSAEVKPTPPAELSVDSAGAGSRQIVPLEQYTFLIGSRYGCDLLLNGPDIALAHAVIFVRDGRRFLRDLSSHTGTLLNNQPCREAELNPGDEIRIGEACIEYRALDDSVQLDDDETSANHPSEATHFTEPVESLREAEPLDEPTSIAFENETVSSTSDSETIPMPWDEPEPSLIDLQPLEAEGR
jgi:pSer/pThr/pTyr-binding forkhead associated (FHA) protein